MTLTFIAYGVAQPKGSAKAFIPKGWTRAIVTSDNPRNKGWQQVVAESANAALRDQAWQFADGVPIQLIVAFALPRPKSIKNKSVPHLTKPDLDKLVRSVKDALTGVVWSDDKQVTQIVASKVYADVGSTPSARVIVTRIED